MRLKSEIVHKGNIVPIEVEIVEGWLGVIAVVVHFPKNYSGGSDIVPMMDLQADLEEEVRPYEEGTVCKTSLLPK